MSSKHFFEQPNESSPTYGLELLVDSAREDVVMHIATYAAIILLVDGHYITGGALAIYAIFQSALAFKKELQLRLFRSSQADSPKENTND